MEASYLVSHTVFLVLTPMPLPRFWQNTCKRYLSYIYVCVCLLYVYCMCIACACACVVHMCMYVCIHVHTLGRMLRLVSRMFFASLGTSELVPPELACVRSLPLQHSPPLRESTENITDLRTRL